MAQIVLKSIRIEGFKSFVNETFVEFAVGGGFRFLTGVNEVEPRLGANGAGKSSLWDALIWCLYGTSVRGQRAAELVSWGQKQPKVWVTLDVDSEEHEVCRTGSPNKLYLNSAPAEQSEVDRLCRLSRGRFVHAVMFGQNVPLFLDLSIPERANLLDEVLDLGLWLRLSERASKRVSALTAETQKLERDLSYVGGQLASLSDVTELERRSAAHEAEQQRRVDEAITRVEEAEAALPDIVAQSDAAFTAAQALPNIRTVNDRVEQLHKQSAHYTAEHRILASKIGDIQERLNFYKEHKRTCPTCKQGIDARFLRDQVAALTQALAEATDANRANSAAQRNILEELGREEETLRTLITKRDFHTRRLAQAQGALEQQRKTIDQLVAEVERIASAAHNPYVEQIRAVHVQREALTQARATIDAELVQRRAETLKFDYWRAGFKKVRLFMIKRVLAHLEVEVANAASALGLPDWKIMFSTEIETKSGTLKPGIHIQVTSPQATGAWEAWSGGEGQRIRLAVAIGFAALIQRMAGVNYGFEIWDEPSAWLSPEGIEDLLTCLKYRSDAENKSVWLVDHRALAHSGFSEIWCVRKTQSGSQIEVLSKEG